MAEDAAEARDTIENLLTDAFLGTEELITRWVLVAEVIASETGERHLWMLNPETMEVWDTLGLIAYIQEVLRAAVTTTDD